MVHRLRNLLRPESKDTGPFLLLIAINHIMKSRSQIIQINSNAGRRIMSLCKREICRKFRISVGKTVRSQFICLLHHLLSLFPFLNIPTYKRYLFHPTGSAPDKFCPKPEAKVREL